MRQRGAQDGPSGAIWRSGAWQAKLLRARLAKANVQAPAGVLAGWVFVRVTDSMIPKKRSTTCSLPLIRARVGVQVLRADPGFFRLGSFNLRLNASRKIPRGPDHRAGRRA